MDKGELVSRGVCKRGCVIGFPGSITVETDAYRGRPIGEWGLQAYANIPFLSGYTLASLPTVLYVYIAVTGIGFTCYFLGDDLGAEGLSDVLF